MAGRKEMTGMRLACDGCHIRKLRCSRNSSTCVRCLRDGVQCVYSPARKGGRPSKAEQMASRTSKTNSSANAVEVLESLRGHEAEYSTPPQAEQDTSHTTFWGPFSTDGYTHLPLEGFWNELHHSGGEPGNEDAVEHYGSMTIASQAFRTNDDDVTMYQLQNIRSTYNEMANSFGSEQNRQTSGNMMEPKALINPPRERSDSKAEVSLAGIYNKIQRLSDLEQELFTHRSRLPDNAADDCFGEVVDVDAIIGTSQAILDLTSGLFTNFANGRPRTDQERLGKVTSKHDAATMLLALTPSFLVVTTYNDVLSLISAALDDIGHSKTSPPGQSSCLDTFTESHNSETPSHPPTSQAKQDALFSVMAFKVGKAKLDFPLRLILSMSIIEYQLGPLERALQLIRSNHFRSQPSDASRGLLATSIDGLRLAIEALLNKAGKLVGQARMLDIG